jgi:hypothetical protein
MLVMARRSVGVPRLIALPENGINALHSSSGVVPNILGICLDLKLDFHGSSVRQSNGLDRPEYAILKDRIDAHQRTLHSILSKFLETNASLLHPNFLSVFGA